jgi:protein-S-isoprenylcysteine O-methyltransferase Ste14
VFRSQLVFNLFSNLFGEKDLLVWGILFLPFLFLRPVLSLALGLADSGSIGQLRWLQIVLGLALLLPSLYTVWSVRKYFGVKRALGGDHFRAKYRKMGLVREGAFRYSSNAMYSFAFLIFWAIALLTGSWATMVAALFQHAYIWVHWYCTEQPDMHVIYGTDTGAA